MPLRKSFFKKRAETLRRKGYSYSEIQKIVPVSQSTLTLWLGRIPLTEKQRQRLFQKGVESRKLGSKALRKARIEKTKLIVKKADLEVKDLDRNNLWIIGIVLYWAEGHKQKEHDASRGVIFNNSDPLMIKIFIKWLRECLNISDDDIVFEVYIHRTYKRRKDELSKFWSSITGFPIDKFGKVYFKKNKVYSYRKNRGKKYQGVLRVSVKKSTDLNRKITGWINGICREYGVAN